MNIIIYLFCFYPTDQNFNIIIIILYCKVSQCWYYKSFVMHTFLTCLAVHYVMQHLCKHDVGLQEVLSQS